MAVPPIGQVPRRASIAGVSLSVQCQVTTVDPHPFFTGDFVRLTELDYYRFPYVFPTPPTPVLVNIPQLNNNLYDAEKNGANTFLLRDTITKEYIDSTNFTPYIAGGQCTLENHTFIFYPPPP